jgi:hypothetical protein
MKYPSESILGQEAGPANVRLILTRKTGQLLRVFKA